MLRAARLAIACLVLAALVTQYARGHASATTFVPANFFSFFTVESEHLRRRRAAGRRSSLGSPRTDAWRGARDALHGRHRLVYVVLLSGLEDRLQTPIPWVNAVLHYITPVFMVADWLLDPPERPVPFRRAAWWLAVPLAYCAYSPAARAARRLVSVSVPRPARARLRRRGRDVRRRRGDLRRPRLAARPHHAPGARAGVTVVTASRRAPARPPGRRIRGQGPAALKPAAEERPPDHVDGQIEIELGPAGRRPPARCAAAPA